MTVEDVRNSFKAEHRHCTISEKCEISLEVRGHRTQFVELRLFALLDFKSRAKYLAVEVPARFDWSCGVDLINAGPQLLGTAIDGLRILFDTYSGEPPVSLSELVFTGLLTLISEEEVSLQLRQQLLKAGEARGWRVTVYDPSNVRANLEAWRAFISYASADQEEIVQPLVNELVRRWCPVWFDGTQIRPGDSLRQKLEDGIRRTNKCILILSKNYLANTRYALSEFDSFFTKERLTGRKLFIPIWVDVSQSEVFDYSPSLADRAAVIWNGDASGAASTLANVLVDVKACESS